MALVFSSIKNGTIFQDDFEKLTPENGTIKFKHINKNQKGGIAVIYAPNGTGKSSLCRVLEAETSSDTLSFVATSGKKKIEPQTKAFHIIPEQVTRNVIRGKETDYLIGKDIQREYALRDKIDKVLENVYSNLRNTFKQEYNITAVKHFLLTQIASLYNEAFGYIQNIVNKQKKSKDIDWSKFIAFIRDSKNEPSLSAIDENEKAWIIKNIEMAKKIINIDTTIAYDSNAIQVEKHDDALRVLRKYHDSAVCIVCDNNKFNGHNLLKSKEASHKRIYDSLSQETKSLLNEVLNSEILMQNDVFNAKAIVRKLIAGGDSTQLEELKTRLKVCVNAVCAEIVDILFHCFEDNSSFFKEYDEYNMLISKKPQFDSEKLLYIEKVINENIGKNITIERDEETKNYKLKIGDKDLLQTEREAMELSTGEQNFVSLAFELLLACNLLDKHYVVLDDPISSFDSIYKNKIAYCIIKFLENKEQIVLTHNTDLIRLLHVQSQGCFNLYILNNVENGKNGFIPISDAEKNLLINLNELVKLFQNKNKKIQLISFIKNKKLFLMSMIPFMRGYAHIGLDKRNYYGKLSDVMHGYRTKKINAVPIYKNLFGYDFGDKEIISVADILNLDCSHLDIIDEKQFPLLAETLRQTLIYYHLRMKVEKELVEVFEIQINSNDILTLNQIVMKAFADKDGDTAEIKNKKMQYRVYFTSRKTLLNEFNHFEGNMNIFQPAIDINPVALQKEVADIKNKLEDVKKFAQELKNAKTI